MTSTAIKMTEEQMIGLVRNALIVAGMEMGTEGDHWPVIKTTIHTIMKDWEDLKIERNVHGELRTHLYHQLDQMDKILETCPDNVKADAGPKLKQLREIYDAYFSESYANDLYLSEEDAPMHVKRAEKIIKTLEDDDA